MAQIWENGPWKNMLCYMGISPRKRSSKGWSHCRVRGRKVFKCLHDAFLVKALQFCSLLIAYAVVGNRYKPLLHSPAFPLPQLQAPMPLVASLQLLLWLPGKAFLLTQPPELIVVFQGYITPGLCADPNHCSPARALTGAGAEGKGPGGGRAQVSFLTSSLSSL